VFLAGEAAVGETAVEEAAIAEAAIAEPAGCRGVISSCYASFDFVVGFSWEGSRRWPG